MKHRLSNTASDASTVRTYPADPDKIGAHASRSAALPLLGVDTGRRQRRWTILLRLFLALPHLLLVSFAGILAYVVRLLGWVAALFAGRLPAWCAHYLGWYLGYAIRVTGYAYLLVDRYPPVRSGTGTYPVQVVLPEPSVLNRWAVLFRSVLAFPILVLSALFAVGWTVAGVFIWMTVLVFGRTPRPIADASIGILRVTLRTQAYYFMLTPEYLKGVFGDPEQVSTPSRATSKAEPRPAFPLHLSSGGRALMVGMLVLGTVAYCAQIMLSIAATPQNVVAQDNATPTADQNTVIEMVSNYYGAVKTNDGARACSILAPAFAESLATRANTDNCPAAVDLTYRGQPQSRLDQIANIRYDARDAVVNGSTASLKIYSADGGTAKLAQEILLEKQPNGQWLIVSLG